MPALMARKVNGIMADISPTGRNCIEAQADMFRRAKRDLGLSVEVIANTSPLKLSTLKGWASGRTAMPAWAIGELHSAGMPTDILSILFDAWKLHLLTDEEGCDHALDTATAAAIDFAAEMGKARSAKSRGGPALVPQEKTILREKAGRLATLARRAARGS